MEYKFLRVTVLLLVTFAWYPSKKSCCTAAVAPAPGRITPQVTTAQQNNILQGIAAGAALATVLKEGDFRESLQKIGTKLSLFMGVLGPLASIALSFIPTGDSDELAYMKQEFRKVNNKLDIVNAEFTEVKNAIDWSTVAVSYGEYELKIRAADANLQRIYDVERAQRETERQNFITQYDSDFENSVQKLYDVIVNDDHVFSTNVLEAAVRQTRNHKRKFEQFCLGLVQLLIQGIQVKISYYAMKNQSSGHVVDEWYIKMTTLKSKLEQTSNEVQSRWPSQLITDVEEIIVRGQETTTNEQLVEQIYDFLVDKYDWRYFFVAVYNNLYGKDKHNYVVCGGGAFLHRGNKNVLVASQSNDHQFNQDDAVDLVQSVVDDINRCRPGLRERRLVRAEALVLSALGKSQSRCSPNRVILGVATHDGFQSRSLSGHQAMRRIRHRYKQCCWDIPRTNQRKCSQTFWHHDLVVFG